MLDDFISASENWVSEEKENNIFYTLDTTLASQITGDNNLDDVLKSSYDNFNLLDGCKKDLAKILTKENAVDSINYNTISLSNKTLSDIDNLSSDIIEKVNQIKNLVQSPPAYSEKKENIDQAINNLKQRTFTNNGQIETPASDYLQDLVDNDVILQEDLDDFIFQVTIPPTQLGSISTKTIQELNPRYYVSSTSINTESYNGSLDLGYTIIDQDNNEVESLYGKTGKLNANGVISFEDGTSLSIIPKTDFKRNETTFNKPSEGLYVPTNELVDEFSYEIWSCVVLDIMDYIESQYQKMVRKLNELANAYTQQNKIATNSFLGAIDYTTDSLTDLSNIINYNNNIIQSVTSKEINIGISNILRNEQGIPNPSLTVCESNQTNYCGIHESLIDYLNDIEITIQADSLNFGGISVSDLSYDLIDITNKIGELRFFLNSIFVNIKEAIQKLKRDLCAIIAGRIKGIPKNLVALLNLMQQISPIIQSFSILPPEGYGIEENPDMSSIILRLRESGYERAADLLESGDVTGFFAVTTLSSNYAGQTSLKIREAAENEEDINTYRELFRLSESARSKSEQKIIGQRVREGYRKRRNINRSYTSSKLITEMARDKIK